MLVTNIPAPMESPWHTYFCCFLYLHIANCCFVLKLNIFIGIVISLYVVLVSMAQRQSHYVSTIRNTNSVIQADIVKFKCPVLASRPVVRCTADMCRGHFNAADSVNCKFTIISDIIINLLLDINLGLLHHV